MAESMGIRSAKSYGKSYGSTRKSTQKTFLNHIVSQSDTLQGLSLKYNVTVEEIKRANKLFTNDSLFMRSTLSIPLGDQPLPVHLLESAGNSAIVDVSSSPTRQPGDDGQGPATNQEPEGAGEEEGEEEPRDETMDFFNRIDRQVREKKSRIKKIERKTSIEKIEKATSSPSRNSPAFYSTKDGTLPSYHGDHPLFQDDPVSHNDITLATRPDNGEIDSHAFDLHPEKL